eukprot:CAMPEP_0113496142 /NCGR_PEP_ID=MMETSP0014_2-20120614/29967_1 /TAXON_ID=2857 /ORGANISM="Nitzschia sp." /LENGTH=952 /DNA_ID=CAMNT_0000390051 /DNA_START=65 /DNA_END=2922 /DNA_ORIENTATION=+ /assembly_acc=CAM_ASM_000159
MSGTVTPSRTRRKSASSPAARNGSKVVVDREGSTKSSRTEETASSSTTSNEEETSCNNSSSSSSSQTPARSAAFASPVKVAMPAWKVRESVRKSPRAGHKEHDGAGTTSSISTTKMVMTPKAARAAAGTSTPRRNLSSCSAGSSNRRRRGRHNDNDDDDDHDGHPKDDEKLQGVPCLLNDEKNEAGNDKTKKKKNTRTTMIVAVMLLLLQGYVLGHGHVMYDRPALTVGTVHVNVVVVKGRQQQQLGAVGQGHGKEQRRGREVAAVTIEPGIGRFLSGGDEKLPLVGGAGAGGDGIDDGASVVTSRSATTSASRTNSVSASQHGMSRHSRRAARRVDILAEIDAEGEQEEGEQQQRQSAFSPTKSSPFQGAAPIAFGPPKVFLDMGFDDDDDPFFSQSTPTRSASVSHATPADVFFPPVQEFSTPKTFTRALSLATAEAADAAAAESIHSRATTMSAKKSKKSSSKKKSTHKTLKEIMDGPASMHTPRSDARSVAASVADSVASSKVQEKIRRAKAEARMSPESVPSLFHSAVGIKKKSSKKKSTSKEGKIKKKKSKVIAKDEKETDGASSKVKKTKKSKEKTKKKSTNTPKKAATASAKPDADGQKLGDSYDDFVADTDFADINSDDDNDDETELAEDASITNSVKGFNFEVPITPLSSASLSSTKKKKKSVIPNDEDHFKVVQKLHESVGTIEPLFELPTGLMSKPKAAPKKQHKARRENNPVVEQDPMGYPVISFPTPGDGDDGSVASDVSSIVSETSDWTEDKSIRSTSIRSTTAHSRAAQSLPVPQSPGFLRPSAHDHSTRSRKIEKVEIPKLTGLSTHTHTSRVSTSTASTAWQLREQNKHQRRPGRTRRSSITGSTPQTPQTCQVGRKKKISLDGNNGRDLPSAFAGLATPVRSKPRKYIAPMTPSARRESKRESKTRRGDILASLDDHSIGGDDEVDYKIPGIL